MRRSAARSDGNGRVGAARGVRARPAGAGDPRARPCARRDLLAQVGRRFPHGPSGEAAPEITLSVTPWCWISARMAARLRKQHLQVGLARVQGVSKRWFMTPLVFLTLLLGGKGVKGTKKVFCTPWGLADPLTPGKLRVPGARVPVTHGTDAQSLARALHGHLGDARGFALGCELRRRYPSICRVRLAARPLTPPAPTNGSRCLKSCRSRT